METYLSLDLPRDVIERPLVDEYDVNGWDIRKALQLLLKGNPTLNEWMQSPIRYQWGIWADSLAELAREGHDVKASYYHYLDLCESTLKKYLWNVEQVRMKKYLYAIRPVLALRWLRLHDTVPPMDLPSIRRQVDLDADVEAEIDSLIAAKHTLPEATTMPHVKLLDELIASECAAAREMAPKRPRELNPELLPQANDLYRRIVKSR